MKKFLVFLCLALCMILFVCSCGGGNDTDTNTDTNTDTDTEASTNTDTSTDTNTDTDTDSNIDTGINLNDGKYRVFVCNEAGEGIEGVYVQYCTDTICDFKSTDSNGYVEIPTGEHHIASVTDENGVYENVVYAEADYLHFEGDSKLITIVLESK